MTLTHRQGSLLVLAAGVIFSFNAIIFRMTDDISAWQYLTVRGLGAAFATTVVFGFQNRRRHLAVLRTVRVPHVVAGVILGLMMSSFIVALTMTTAAFILFVQSASPVVAALCSWFLLGERMTRAAKLASVVVVAGVVVMVGGNVGNANPKAILVSLVIPFGLGLYTTLLRGAGSIDPSFPVIVAGVTTAAIGTSAALAGGGFTASARDLALGFVAGAALLGVALPFFNLAQPAVPSPEATLLLMSEVVLAPIWVWIWPGETPSVATLVGGAIILAAVIWLTLQPAPIRQPN